MGPFFRGRNSKFTRYYTWLRSASSSVLALASSDAPLFPACLPYPEALLKEPGELVKDDFSTSLLWAKSFVNMLVAWSNYVVLGCPDYKGDKVEPQTAYLPSEAIRPFADGLLGELTVFGSPELLAGKLTCEGKRRSVEELLERLSCTVSSYEMPLETEEFGGSSVAMPVVAQRIAVPTNAGTVDPVEWLPADKAEVVRRLDELLLPPALWDEVVTACHRVPKAEEAGLMKKLLECGMVSLFPEDELPRDPKGKPLVAGLFCVKKNEKEDRLILDRRPANAMMERLRWAELPSAACFTRMLLRDNQFLRASGDDLRNYYYALKLPPCSLRYNAVGRRVPQKLVKLMGADPTRHYRLAFRVLGMGDRNACDIAQAVHQHVLQTGGLLAEDDTLVYGSPVPEGDLWEGIYLDDLLIALRMTMPHTIPLNGSFQPPVPQVDDVDVQHVKAAEAAYQAAGLQRAEHKSFRFEPRFRAWGAEVDGVLGTVGSPLAVRQQVWWLLKRVVEQGSCTKVGLQQILGYVCFMFSFRREFYSLQHHIYKFLRTCPEKGICRLPGFVLDELRAIALHIPFAFHNMRRKIADQVLATDATPTSGGGVRADVSNSLAEKLLRLSEVKGSPVRLDGDYFEHDSHSAPKEPSKFASSVSECLRWRVTSSYSFHNTKHVNLQEAKALKKELVSFARHFGNRGKIQICFNDSQVCVGAFAKGRSSSFRLNGILRSLLPHLLFGDIQAVLLWVETKSNAADHPSRFSPLPPPRRAPSWMRKLGVGGGTAPGWEIFAGSARLTRARLQRGCSMYTPVEIQHGTDAFDPCIDVYIREKRVGWVWLAPPCGTFSPLRNLDRKGPLRPRGCPQGDENDPEVCLGNRLWERAVALVWLCLCVGVPVFLEHPRGSKAWQLPSSQKLMCCAGLKLHEVHWCAYDDLERVGLPNKKPTRILSSAPWLAQVCRCCPQSHHHGPPLRGHRAKLAGAYPWGFCHELAEAYKGWLDGSA